MSRLLWEKKNSPIRMTPNIPDKLRQPINAYFISGARRRKITTRNYLYFQYKWIKLRSRLINSIVLVPGSHTYLYVKKTGLIFDDAKRYGPQGYLPLFAVSGCSILVLYDTNQHVKTDLAQHRLIDWWWSSSSQLGSEAGELNSGPAPRRLSRNLRTKPTGRRANHAHFHKSDAGCTRGALLVSISIILSPHPTPHPPPSPPASNIVIVVVEYIISLSIATHDHTQKPVAANTGATLRLHQ